MNKAFLGESEQLYQKLLIKSDEDQKFGHVELTADLEKGDFNGVCLVEKPK